MTFKDRARSLLADHRLPWLLTIVCALMPFLDLGAAALFEPDEGRNAERAREILVLGNWAVPHENFLPALDKPIFFYWLIALFYKLFGISEWSARLPSALAAIFCLVWLYRFVSEFRNPWESLGSVLVLGTSLEFFIFARIVIFDMTLTLFTSIALFEFYRATVAENQTAQRRGFLLMYAAIAVATLVKGPIGAAIPAMVIFLYLLISRRWQLLARMEIVRGTLLFLAIAAPWYIWAEIRNPGYLRYFFWEENFLRFLTLHFQRSKPAYYYLVVIAAGFAPWSVLIPSMVKTLWQKGVADRDLFLLIWIVTPLIFFSLSNSKLPHYVLPIFPPLAILTVKTLTEVFNTASPRSLWPLSLPLITILVASVYLMVGTVWDEVLPSHLRRQNGWFIPAFWTSGALLCIVFGKFLLGAAKGKWREPRFVYLCYGAAGVVYLFLIVQVSISLSYNRSAKNLARHLAQHIAPGDQVAFYDDYLTGMPFYLLSEQPIWIVWSGEKPVIMDNIYIAQKQPPPANGYGQVLFNFGEFAKASELSTRPIRVIVKAKFADRVWPSDKIAVKILTQNNGYALATNR